MGTSATFYTSTDADAQEAWSTSYAYTGANTFGYPGSTAYNMMYRVQPSIDQSSQRVVVDTATSTIQAQSTNGDGAFTAPVGVHNGSCGTLNTQRLANAYTSIGTKVNVSIPATHVVDDSLSATITNLAQLWFNRADYTSTDYIGIVWETGDSAKDEYYDIYIGSFATQAKRCRLALTYHMCSKAKPHGKANTSIKNAHGVLRNNIGRFSGI